MTAKQSNEPRNGLETFKVVDVLVVDAVDVVLLETVNVAVADVIVIGVVVDGDDVIVSGVSVADAVVAEVKADAISFFVLVNVLGLICVSLTVSVAAVSKRDTPSNSLGVGMLGVGI